MKNEFEEVASLDCDTTLTIGGVNKTTGKANPTEIEGYYLGVKKVPSTMAKSGFSLLHILMTSEGNVGVWGKTGLNRKLDVVAPGQYVAVEFSGMKKIKNFPPMYTYRVGIKKGDTIDVASASNNVSNEDSDYASDVESNDLYEEASNEVESFQPPVQRAAPIPPSAAAQAKARALLSGSRKS